MLLVSSSCANPCWLRIRMLQTTEVPREVGLRLNASQPTTWLFLSDETNSWGQTRSYAIMPAGRKFKTSER